MRFDMMEELLVRMEGSPPFRHAKDCFGDGFFESFRASSAKETESHISKATPRLTFLLIEARWQGLFGECLVFLTGLDLLRIPIGLLNALLILFDRLEPLLCNRNSPARELSEFFL